MYNRPCGAVAIKISKNVELVGYSPFGPRTRILLDDLIVKF